MNEQQNGTYEKYQHRTVGGKTSENANTILDYRTIIFFAQVNIHNGGKDDELKASLRLLTLYRLITPSPKTKCRFSFFGLSQFQNGIISI